MGENRFVFFQSRCLLIVMFLISRSSSFLCVTFWPCFQLLISGSLDGIDIDDLRAHTNYTGGYHKVTASAILFSFFCKFFSWQQFPVCLNRTCLRVGCIPYFCEGFASCSHKIDYIMYVSLKLMAEVYTFKFIYLFFYFKKISCIIIDWRFWRRAQCASG